MREIRFRGKRLDNGEWIYGFYNRTYTYEQGYKDCIFNHYTGFIDVMSATVGQFTGLYDKNGKEIYEGDIVLSKLSSISLSLLEDYHTVEVIGNAHDNPEMLNKRDL